LQAQPSLDGFHYQHHKSRLQNKTRILRLHDLEFPHKRTNLSKIIGWRICQANQRILFTTAMDTEPPVRFASRALSADLQYTAFAEGENPNGFRSPAGRL
jgi:hypothetical protein